MSGSGFARGAHPCGLGSSLGVRAPEMAALSLWLERAGRRALHFISGSECARRNGELIIVSRIMQGETILFCQFLLTDFLITSTFSYTPSLQLCQWVRESCKYRSGPGVLGPKCSLYCRHFPVWTNKNLYFVFFGRKFADWCLYVPSLIREVTWIFNSCILIFLVGRRNFIQLHFEMAASCF